MRGELSPLGTSSYELMYTVLYLLMRSTKRPRAQTCPMSSCRDTGDSCESRVTRVPMGVESVDTGVFAFYSTPLW